MKPSFLILLGCLAASGAFARLGDTLDQAIDRYGLPKPQKQQPAPSPLLEGAKEYVFEYQGWKIRCALVMAIDGMSYVVREEYAKILKPGGNPQITDAERQAILEGEGGLAHWTAKAPTAQTWGRPDGAVAILGTGGTPLRLELPQAGTYEQALKASREQKAKAPVPKF